MITLFFLIVCGRVVSLGLYRMCWTNAASGEVTKRGAMMTLLRRPLYAVVHVFFLWPMVGLSWQEWPRLHGCAVMLASLLAVGAIGRFGSADLNRFFIVDRLLALVLAVGVWFSPVFLYPCLVSCCCLQYTVSSWRLGSGYSNLLGYEFIRASLSVMIAGLTVFGWCKCSGAEWAGVESALLAVMLGYQASTYVNHSLAKSALGPKWYSWMVENRLECFIANAWLRGWTFGRNEDYVMKQVRWVARHRIMLCTCGWLLEFSWLGVLVDARIAQVILSITVLMHLMVFVLTGLIAYQYVVNHLFLMVVIHTQGGDGMFGWKNFTACVIAIALTAVWIGYFRRRIFAEYQQSGTMGEGGIFADAADHLMAWWDTPFMRMYSYTVESHAHEHFALPVPKLSPQDTSLTDIHTHWMILGIHTDFDTKIGSDRAVARIGVWGLTVHRQDRDFLYQMMDSPESKTLDTLRGDGASRPWSRSESGGEPIDAAPLRALFEGMNREIDKKWFQLIMLWPHIPGEDLAPDQCPLVEPRFKDFRFDQAIACVTIWRVKTFYRKNGFSLIEREAVGRIELDCHPALS
jgi:hypothetical protein